MKNFFWESKEDNRTYKTLKMKLKDTLEYNSPLQE